VNLLRAGLVKTMAQLNRSPWSCHSALAGYAEIVEARQVFSLLAVKELGYSGAEVERYLGVTNSCVTRAVLAKEAPEKGNCI